MADSYVETASNAAAATAVQTVAGSSVSHVAAATGSSGTVPSSALPVKGAASLSRASSIGLAAFALLASSLFALVA